MAGSNSEWIVIEAQDGGEFRAYGHAPVGGRGPGVMVLQEAFGINEYVREVVDWFADLGYWAVAPDMFWRIEPGITLEYSEPEIAQAIELLGRFDYNAADGDMAATVARMRTLPGLNGGIGTVGFCLGGRLAYRAAAHSTVDCAVSYYGVGIENDLDLAGRIDRPLLLHFGGKDQFVAAEALKKIQSGLKGRDDIAIHLYPDASHGFNNKRRPAFDEKIVQQARARTLDFLATSIGESPKLSDA